MTWLDAPSAGIDLPSGRFVLRPIDPERDVSLVHGWMNDPEVARFWELAEPPDRIAGYLCEQVGSAHSTPYIGELDGVPMSYWELYRADLDPLARHYPARRGDAGVHLLLGTANSRGRGLGTQLLRVVAGWQLAADPLATRVVAEPDVGNARSVRAFERAGFRRAMDVDLPDKRAALMIRDRDPDVDHGPTRRPDPDHRADPDQYPDPGADPEYPDLALYARYAPSRKRNVPFRGCLLRVKKSEAGRGDDRPPAGRGDRYERGREQ